MKKNRLNAVGGGFIVLVKCRINKCDPSAQGSKDDAWRNTERRNSWYAMVIPVNCDTTLSAGNTLKSIPSKRGACLWYTSTWWVDFCYIILQSLRNNHHKQPPALLCYSLPPIILPRGGVTSCRCMDFSLCYQSLNEHLARSLLFSRSAQLG